ncbi:MAG: phosphotransferase, partial [Pseudomonadota bacterium]|nr:MAG: aminoglycoside phosphotransferase family protein [Pseudomonadota bacterium]
MNEVWALLDLDHVARFVERRLGERPKDLGIGVEKLRGGLMARAVVMVVARYRDRAGKRRTDKFVVKHLEGPATREALVYETVLHPECPLAPTLFEVERAQRGVRLYLEAVVPKARWPWRDPTHAASVLERLAQLHETEPAIPLGDWDYDAELARTAAETLEHVERFPALPGMARSRAALRRLASNAVRIRRELLSWSTLPRALVHGDVHPGNVLVRRRSGCDEPVFLDWGRARVGSPLEDVSSWLTSLGFWEPVVKSKHDTLLGVYLSARGLSPRLSREVRDAHWLAGALNCLAGSLGYHVQVASDPRVGERRRHAAVRAAEDCLRVIRRADARFSA